MYIKKVVIQNYKCFNGQFTLELNSGLNIIVGDNEVGKSTILEAINLCLSGWLNGKYLKSEINESLFNKDVVAEYLKKVNDRESDSEPPSILIELFCDFGSDALNESFRGDKNILKDKNESGIRFKIDFDQSKTNEYIEDTLNSGEELFSLPIEYCDFSWESFSRIAKIPRTIPMKSSLIDSSNFRYRNGADINASRIIRDKLTEEEETLISQAHRKLKDKFANDPSVDAINKKIQKGISEKKVSLQIETSTKNSWESSLMPHIDDIPFQNAGKGEQCLIKTKLALQQKKTERSNVILIEEPENHLSHSKLNELTNYIDKNNNGKQVIVSTHSSFVANKLGLQSLILLNVDSITAEKHEFKIEKLAPSTQNYFKKLPGYDTLRLLLCRKAILVEGDSDELIVQKAYEASKGKLPIQDGVDVISVRSLAFKRFLDIAIQLKQPAVVVTDNDGEYDQKIVAKYSKYSGVENILISASPNNELPTLEPHLVSANENNLDKLRNILNLDSGKYPDSKSISEYMIKNKTACAMKIFDSDQEINFPDYINSAVEWEYDKK